MLVMTSSNDPVRSLDNSCFENIVIAICTDRSQAWSPYSFNGRRTCFWQCFKEDFNALDLLITNISYERSIFMIITTTWRPSHSWTD